MNCTRIEALLPLYVSADLPPRELEIVRTHLTTCAACGGELETLAASQTWLQAAPLPEFDEAFFDGLRADVRQAIATSEEQTRRGGLAHWFERWLPVWPSVGTWTWAGAAALAVALLMLALNWTQFFGRQPLQESAGTFATPTPLPTALPLSPALNPAPVEAPQLARRTVPTASRPKTFKPLRRLPESADLAATQTAAPPHREVAPVETKLANNTNPAALPEMMRIELQTADPNIRIIWLTPKTANASPAEPSSK